jgi:hypothetical protein
MIWSVRLKDLRIDDLRAFFSSPVDENHDRGSGGRLDLNAAGQPAAIIALLRLLLGLLESRLQVPVPAGRQRGDMPARALAALLDHDGMMYTPAAKRSHRAQR